MGGVAGDIQSFALCDSEDAVVLGSKANRLSTAVRNQNHFT
jgi:hypothetical protein